MDNYVIGPRRRTVLSYFTNNSVAHDIDRDAPAAAATPLTTPRLTLNIFCDGACMNNGRRGARGGYGVVVYRDNNIIFELSEPLSLSEPQTNQRAELRAMMAAVNYALSAVASGATTIRIYTDSEYTQNCLTRWAHVWRRSNWCRANGEPVLHRDIIEPLITAWDQLRGIAFLHHVNAHTGRSDFLSVGNAHADFLARRSIVSSFTR